MTAQGATLRRVDQEWYDVEEVARRMRVSEFTVRRWLRSGALRGRKLPGTRRWRVFESDLREFLNSDEAREQQCD